jgi:uncharacterized cupin superfamily protein
MPRIDLKSVPERKGSTYPPPYDEPARGRIKQALGDAGGLTQFGVNLTRLPPGAWSSQRHWHSREDEFIWIVDGEVVLITDAGEEILRAGDCVAFPKDKSDGHHIVNRSNSVAIYLEVGTRTSDDVCAYSDIDMQLTRRDGTFRHRDGTPYPPRGG